MVRKPTKSRKYRTININIKYIPTMYVCSIVRVKFRFGIYRKEQSSFKVK